MIEMLDTVPGWVWAVIGLLSLVVVLMAVGEPEQKRSDRQIDQAVKDFLEEDARLKDMTNRELADALLESVWKDMPHSPGESLVFEAIERLQR